MELLFKDDKSNNYEWVNINLNKEIKYDNLHTLHWIQFAGTEKVCVDLCNELSKRTYRLFITK